MKEKIEQEAMNYLKANALDVDQHTVGDNYNCFTEGAKFAYNAALSEAIEKVRQVSSNREVIKVLEGLKIKP